MEKWSNPWECQIPMASLYFQLVASQLSVVEINVITILRLYYL